MRALSTESIQPELLLPLAHGTIVRCFDGLVGEVTWSSYTEVVVVHSDRPLGRGPWHLARHQVEPATAEEAWGYAGRVQAFNLATLAA